MIVFYKLLNISKTPFALLSNRPSENDYKSFSYESTNTLIYQQISKSIFHEENYSYHCTEKRIELRYSTYIQFCKSLYWLSIFNLKSSASHSFLVFPYLKYNRLFIIIFFKLVFCNAFINGIIFSLEKVYISIHKYKVHM